MPARMDVMPFSLASCQEALLQCLSHSLSRMLRSDEAGYLCRPGKDGHGAMRTKQCKAQHISLVVPGHQERIAFGHVQEEIEKNW